MSVSTSGQWYRIPALKDNYIWMLENPSTGALAIVDPGEAEAVMAALKGA